MKKKLNELESRIRRIADNMDGFYHEQDGVRIPHSVFVEWDQTWDVVEDDNPTDEDLEELIGDESTEGTILARIKALEDAG